MVNKMALGWLLLVVIPYCFAELYRPPPNNLRPVVGVLSLPQHSLQDKNYIPHTYVRFVESGGARVVPLKISQSDAQLEELFWKLNGILFIGGDEPFFNPDGSLSRYAQVGCRFVELAKQAYGRGIYYPIWGTCLGHELIFICENNGLNSTLSDVQGEPPYVQSHNFTQEVYTSRMFGEFGSIHAMNILKNEKATWLNHHFAVEPFTVRPNADLSSFFNVLATTRDHHGTEIISFAEAKNYPIYTTQAHPERNPVEFSTASTEVPHSPGAVFMTSYLSQFFVDEARRNMNRFASEEELRPWLVYNLCPVYLDGMMTQVYSF
jgi:gamma-glutamyl hydrolase